MKSAREDIDVSRELQVVLWEAVNEYAAAVAAEADVPPLTVRRMDAVTKVYEAVISCIKDDRASRGTGEREAGRRGLLSHLKFSLVDKTMTVARIDGNWLSSEDIKLVIDGLADIPSEPPSEPPAGHLEEDS